VIQLKVLEWKVESGFGDQQRALFEHHYVMLRQPNHFFGLRCAVEQSHRQTSNEIFIFAAQSLIRIA
jgi:hypothetical protein